MVFRNWALGIGLGIIAISLINSCHNTPKVNKDEFVIEGSLKNCNGNQVSLYEVTPNKSIIVDSTKTNADGDFIFRANGRGDLHKK